MFDASSSPGRRRSRLRALQEDLAVDGSAPASYAGRPAQSVSEKHSTCVEVLEPLLLLGECCKTGLPDRGVLASAAALQQPENLKSRCGCARKTRWTPLLASRSSAKTAVTAVDLSGSQVWTAPETRPSYVDCRPNELLERATCGPEEGFVERNVSVRIQQVGRGIVGRMVVKKRIARLARQFGRRWWRWWRWWWRWC
jgi:hypothetical protein